MAVNVDAVYQTVLTIINKENRGYLTPEEFNRLAVLSQREIFESYFSKQAALSLAPNTMSDFSSPMKALTEKIAEFETNVTINERDNDSFFEYPSDFYRLGVVTHSPAGEMYPVVVDEVGHKEITYINLSHFTAPTEKQAVYVRHEGGIQCYPSDDENAVVAIHVEYVRTPTDPVWGFNQTIFDDDGEVVYDPSESTNFELHPADYQDLVFKILSYAGVVIRDQEISGIGAQLDGKISQTEL